MGVIKAIEYQHTILSTGISEILPADGLRQKLQDSIEGNRPLRVKLGIDPTTKNVHIGHMVPFRKLRQFQDLGHTAVLIIGDFTAMIGDPTGKNKERPGLTFQQVKEHAQTYCSQIFKVIDESKAEVHYQSTWFQKSSLKETIEMASEFSVAHLLSHETFRTRLEKGTRLSLHELFYPLLQAWDSIAVNSDIEIGGIDQKFNILCGRDLQKNLHHNPQTALFLPLLPGLDGEKMSKTSGNNISVLDPPEDMYGKVMSISDTLLPEYFKLASTLDRDLTNDVDPYQTKKAIARNIVEIYHGQEAGSSAELFFCRTISRKEIPSDIPECVIKGVNSHLIDILLQKKLISSKSDGRRLISQGGIKLDGIKVDNPDLILRSTPQNGTVLQVGKRKWLRIHVKYTMDPNESS